MTNKYYQKHKERLQGKVCKKYQNLSEEEKKVKRSKKDIKIFLKKKSRSYLSIREIII